MKRKNLLFKKPTFHFFWMVALLFVCTKNISAQTPELWGMTPNGNSYGNVFKIIGDSSGFSNVHLFDTCNGLNPVGSLVEANNGLLYGVTQYGGAQRYGAIFSLDPNTNSYTIVASFDNIHGITPYCSLVQASDGKLYGKCQAVNLWNTGLIYSFDPITNEIAYHAQFMAASYSYPGGSLYQANDGNLYGMTIYGGTTNFGTLFRYNIAADTVIVLNNFDSVHGCNPWGTLLQASNGLLYGMTKNGGLHNWGTIFAYDITVDTFAVLYSFTGLYGLNPDGTLVEVGNGKLYGLLQGSVNVDTSGNIFRYDIYSNTYSRLQAFHFYHCGHPYGSLLHSSNGWLYGMTYYGGPINAGVIFKYNPADSTYQNVYSFDSLHGQFPKADLVEAGNGKLYGITTTGGATNNGVIFSLDTATNAFQDVYDFHQDLDGENPTGNMMQASNGKLYGMTDRGGALSDGIIFSIDPTSNTYSRLYNFDFINGYYPRGSLIQAHNGLLYGMTIYGGIYDTVNNGIGDGVILSFDPTSNAFVKVHDFNLIEGRRPLGNLLEATDGKLYGMTSGGGTGNVGVIFSFDPSNNNFEKLYDLGNNSGSMPYGNLIQAVDGKLYGMTYYGSNYPGGAIFSYDISTHIYLTIHYFSQTDGQMPQGSLLQASDGKLYGMTSYLANIGGGTLFSLDPANNQFQVLYNSFPGDNDCSNSLIQASDGLLYGMHRSYTYPSRGFIFKYNISTSSLSPILVFNGRNGAQPSGELMERSICVLNTLTVSPNSSICPGDSVTLTSNGALQYVWQPGNLNGASITVSPTSNTVYTVTGRSDSCINTARVMVMVRTNPNIFPLGITDFCQGDSAVLTSTLADAYLWNTGATSQSIIVDTAGLYTVSVTYNTNAGCSFVSANDTVIIHPLPPVPTIIRHGDSLFSSLSTNYQWYRNGNNIPGAVNQLFFPNQDGIYTVSDTNTWGCISYSLPYHLTDLGLPIITQNNFIHLFPNPFSKQTVLLIDDFDASKYGTFVVYDLYGRIVKQVAIHQAQTKIEREDFASGMYFYQVINNHEIYAKGKLIIQ